MPLLLKGWDGSSDGLQPLLSAVGTMMVTPAVVHGILHKAEDSYVRLSDKFSQVSAKRLTTLSGAIAFGLMSASHSMHETNQKELYQARAVACNGLKEGKAGFTFKGQDMVVDCATMLTPTK